MENASESGSRTDGTRDADRGASQPSCGKLIVVEGTDGVGRSTQIALIKEWLELNGYGVCTTGVTRSPLIGRVIETAKTGHSLNLYTHTLLYLADFADRLEHVILPALKAGMIVLSDRYIYTALARAIVRGAEKAWIRKIYSFAPKPDLVIYLKIEVRELVPRVINSTSFSNRYWLKGTGEGMDYWESGMDLKLGDDFYDSFLSYQKEILRAFDALTREFKFQVVDASSPPAEIFSTIKEYISPVLD